MNQERKDQLHEIIFGTHTPAGKRFDLALLWIILASVVVVMIESATAGNHPASNFLYAAEWVFTILFTFELLLRLYISRKPLSYLFSFWGIIDLLSVLPTYLSLLLPGSQYLLIIRIMRLLRIFRILQLKKFNIEALRLVSAMKHSFHKIVLFLTAIVSLMVILGTMMYLVEGKGEGFTSIPQSIYWAIVTITTVGYGDVVPTTVLGKLISSVAMILGYAIIAVPTGIVTVEMSKMVEREEKKCENCNTKIAVNTNFCSNCGKAQA